MAAESAAALGNQASEDLDTKTKNNSRTKNLLKSMLTSIDPNDGILHMMNGSFHSRLRSCGS